MHFNKIALVLATVSSLSLIPSALAHRQALDPVTHRLRARASPMPLALAGQQLPVPVAALVGDDDGLAPIRLRALPASGVQNLVPRQGPSQQARLLSEASRVQQLVPRLGPSQRARSISIAINVDGDQDGDENGDEDDDGEGDEGSDGDNSGTDEGTNGNDEEPTPTQRFFPRGPSMVPRSPKVQQGEKKAPACPKGFQLMDLVNDKDGSMFVGCVMDMTTEMTGMARGEADGISSTSMDPDFIAKRQATRLQIVNRQRLERLA